MPQLYLLNTLSIPDPQYPTNPPALPINKVFYSSPYIFTMDLENGLFMYPMYRVRAYQFDPTAKTFTLKDDFYTRFTFPVFDAAFDGTYLHVGGVEWNGAGLRAYQFNGSIWVFNGMIDTGSAPRYGSQDQVVATITDGTYIYVAKTMSFLYSCATSMRKCYTFNGTTYTQVGVSNSLLLMIFADSGYLYCSSGNNVLAYDHTFSLLQTQAVGFSFSAGAGDGTYVYFGSSTSNIIKIYSFNGSAFTYIGSYTETGSTGVNDIKCQGGYIVVSHKNIGISLYQLSGVTLSLVANDNSGTGSAVWSASSSSQLVFSARGVGGLAAYQLLIPFDISLFDLRGYPCVVSSEALAFYFDAIQNKAGVGVLPRW